MIVSKEGGREREREKGEQFEQPEVRKWNWEKLVGQLARINVTGYSGRGMCGADAPRRWGWRIGRRICTILHETGLPNAGTR